MTLLELVKQMNDLVENDLVSAQAEVNLNATVIALDDNTCITFGDEEDDDEYYDDVDESNYDPYMGCDFYDCGGYDDF